MISVFTLIKATPVISVGNRARSPFNSCCLVLLVYGGRIPHT
jgi:hypothetical protein